LGGCYTIILRISFSIKILKRCGLFTPRPGEEVADLKGGVAGGSILKGVTGMAWDGMGFFNVN
jgi:hypothetical protein